MAHIVVPVRRGEGADIVWLSELVQKNCMSAHKLLTD